MNGTGRPGHPPMIRNVIERPVFLPRPLRYCRRCECRSATAIEMQSCWRRPPRMGHNRLDDKQRYYRSLIAVKIVAIKDHSGHHRQTQTSRHPASFIILAYRGSVCGSNVRRPRRGAASISKLAHCHRPVATSVPGVAWKDDIPIPMFPNLVGLNEPRPWRVP